MRVIQIEIIIACGLAIVLIAYTVIRERRVTLTDVGGCILMIVTAWLAATQFP